MSFRRTGSFARQSNKTERKDVTSTELANYHRLFTTFDVDNSGYLEFSELQFLLRCLGIFLDDETMEQLREEFDEDGNDLLDFEEFVSLMHRTGELSALRVVSEEEERRHISKVVSKRFTAESRWRWVWDTVILVITGYFVLRTTYEFYDMRRFDIPTYVFEILMTIVLVVDMIVYGNTAYQDAAGKNVENLKDVATRYLTSYFIFDFLGTFPFDLIAIAANTSGYHKATAFTVLRAFRLLRCVRASKTLYLTTNITGLLTPEFVYFTYHVTPVLRSLFYLAVALNALCVGWLLVKDDPTQNYVDSLYLVLFTLTTVGYGDVLIEGNSEKLYCCFLFMCGVLVNGIVISQMSVFLQKADIASERSDKMRETLAVLKHFDIPHTIQAEILSFQNHLLEHNLGSSHASLISSLPVSIQESLALFMKIKYISMVPMFDTANHDCKIALAQSLINIVFRPQEFIIIAGETGKEMYFLGHGIADVIHPKGTYLATLRKGNFFGEIALIVEEAHRTASIKALTYCDVFRLEKRDFATILKKFPAFRDSVKQQMEERVKQFQAQGNTNIIPQRKNRAERIERIRTENAADSQILTVPIANEVKTMVMEAQKASSISHNALSKRATVRSRGTSSSNQDPHEATSIFGDTLEESVLPPMNKETLQRAKGVANSFATGPRFNESVSVFPSQTGVFSMPSFPIAANSSMTAHPQANDALQHSTTRKTFAPPPPQSNAEFRALMDRMSRIESYLAEQAEGVVASSSGNFAPVGEGRRDSAPSNTSLVQTPLGAAPHLDSIPSPYTQNLVVGTAHSQRDTMLPGAVGE